jgi:hypothetical protein
MFRPILERMDAKERKSNAGRKPNCRILMFKMLVLQRLNGLSDDRLQYQLTDRLNALGNKAAVHRRRIQWSRFAL